MTTTTQSSLLYGRKGMTLRLPPETHVIEGTTIHGLPAPEQAVRDALHRPIGTPPLVKLLRDRQPRSVAITISDITRPVPNQVIVTALLELTRTAGIEDQQIVIIIGTGMHRPSTEAERTELLSTELISRCEVIDHRAEDAETLVPVSQSPPVSINRRFAEADFRIVTGLIEPHFMAGFSGGRKGVCPGLADSATVRRFHSYPVMADPRSANGVLEGNPCHAESLRVARLVGVDFLVNVAIDRQRRPAGFYCGDMERAHAKGTEQVARWTTASIDKPFDLVITNGGGYPLDQTFYQSVKGMVSALEALHERSTLLIASHCGEGVGSPSYTQTMMQWGGDWQGFLDHIAAHDEVVKDQWQYQMQTRVLSKIGVERLKFITDALDIDTQHRLAITPVWSDAPAPNRCQKFINTFAAKHPQARIAVIPEGPYTMIQAIQP